VALCDMATVDKTIPDHFRGILCRGVKNYTVEEEIAAKDTLFEGREKEQLLPGEVLIRVTRCGICAGDAKCWSGAPMFWGDETRKPYVETPVIPGHEFVGEVIALGDKEDKSAVKVGDQVTAEQIVACGNCLYCRKGLRWLCAPHDIFGYHRCVHGGMGQYMRFPEKSIIYNIPKRISPSEAVYVEPLSCGVHGAQRGRIELGDTVVVSGCGPIGLGMVAAAKLAGPSRLIALDCMDSRLDIARECGADIVLNPLKTNVVKDIQELTDGYGCDVYLEATGNPKSVEQGLYMIRKNGRFVEFSVFKDKTAVDWTIIGDTKELDILGAHCSGDNGYKVAIDMILRRQIPVERIVTHELSLDNIIQGIQYVNEGKESIKVAIDPTK
jgi:threonine dehydrogenase-like Zn-dependent dehydrogenase